MKLSRCKSHKPSDARLFHRAGDFALVERAQPRAAPRSNLQIRRHKSPQNVDVLIINKRDVVDAVIAFFWFLLNSFIHN